MRLKYTFEIVEMDDEQIAVPVGENAEELHAVLRVNETAAAILKLLEKETNLEEIVDALTREYSGDRAEIADYTREYIETLTEKGLMA